MTSLDQFLLAKTIAGIAHDGQMRKDGRPYITHCDAVAEGVVWYKEKAVAYLHDVVEDTDYWTIWKLKLAGFSDDVIAAVDALSRRSGETYAQFIDRVIEAGPLAILVKLADIDHNLSDQKGLSEEEREFCNKRYGKAKKRLEEALASRTEH
jgi:(p)ppGpp synthase/HD superfamily hydrolase